MNQERFDELTRTLATGKLSRRQVLKALGAGALLSGPLSALAAAPASAKKKKHSKKPRSGLLGLLNLQTYPHTLGHVQALELHPHSDIASIEGWLTIHRPVMSNSNIGDWTITQLNISNAVTTIIKTGEKPGELTKGQGTIEFGWMVFPADPPMGFGDRDPHLYLGVRGSDGVIHQVTDKNPNGFHAVSNPAFTPNANLSELVNKWPVRFAIQYIHDQPAFPHDGWWIWFGSSYIGYIDASWFNTGPNATAQYPLTAANSVAWYGEVGTNNLNPYGLPCTQMGNGTFGSDDGPAQIVNLSYTDTSGNWKFPQIPDALCAGPADLTQLCEHPEAWDGKKLTTSTYDNGFSYGGPGSC